jgi:hypothetical protein
MMQRARGVSGWDRKVRGVSEWGRAAPGFR